jgi:hypothetical protein
MITRLPLSKWWIETDDVTGEIIGTYNKAFITADIQAMKDTLAKEADPTQVGTDLSAILTLITKTDWTPLRKARIVALVEQMYQAYQVEPRAVELAQLQERLDGLIALRERLV